MAFADLKIRTQVLVSVGMVALITVAVIFAVSVGMFASIGTQSQQLVSTSLQNQAQEYLLAASAGSADEIEKKFITMEGLVSMMGTSLAYMFRGTSTYDYVPSYFWWDNSTLPRDVAYNPRWRTDVSYCCSAWYYPESTIDNYTSIMQDPVISDTLNRSAHMDTLFPQLASNNDEVAQLQIGFSKVKVLRRYPAIDAYRSRDYDHTNRPWYQSALSTNGLIYSDPYQNSITFEWTISISQSVVNNDGILAVVALEMRTALIQQSIISQILYNTGYALLIQNDGLVVAGRVWDSNSNTSVNLVSFSNLYDQLQPIGVPRARRVTVDGKDVFVSQSKFIRNRYIIVHIVPAQEVLTTVDSISAQADASFSNVLGVTAAVGVGTLFLVFFLSTFFAAKITKPIVVVSEIAVKIASNAVKDNIMDSIHSAVNYRKMVWVLRPKPHIIPTTTVGLTREDITFKKEYNGEDEIGDLTRAFKSMIDSLSGKPKVSNSEAVIELKTHHKPLQIPLYFYTNK